MIVNTLSRDQAIGAYIGAAVGDAYGAPFEFMGKKDCRRMIGLPRAEFRTGGVHNVEAGEWTDDTAMARCITDSYAQHGEICEYQVMTNFFDWLEHGKFGTRDYCFDVGGSCSRAISDWVMNRKTKKVHLEERQGNGGIMRLAPVITFNSQSYYDAVNDALMSSRLTHENSICDHYAEAVCDVIFDTGLLELENTPSIRAGSGHVRDTFYTALVAFESTDSFLECIHYAASFGGDTDTTAAVAGMIAGSYYGASQIPEELCDGLIDADIIHAEAEMLYQIGKCKGEKHEAQK